MFFVIYMYVLNFSVMGKKRAPAIGRGRAGRPIAVNIAELRRLNGDLFVCVCVCVCLRVSLSLVHT